MSIKQTLGISGSIVLFIGVFAPIISAPIIGNINYFQNGKGDGVIIVVIALVAFMLTLAKKYSGVMLSGIVALGVLIFTFVNIQMKLSEISTGMKQDLAGNPFAGLAEAAMQSIQIQWGWALLVIGAALLIGAGVIRESNNQISSNSIIYTNQNVADGIHYEEGSGYQDQILQFFKGFALLLLLALIALFYYVGITDTSSEAVQIRWGLVFAPIIGLLPGYIAWHKGYKFLWWWLFGAAIFIVALPISIILPKKKVSEIVEEEPQQVTNEDIQETNELVQEDKATEIKCPYCAETVEMDTKFCQYCGREQLISEQINAVQKQK